MRSCQENNDKILWGTLSNDHILTGKGESDGSVAHWRIKPLMTGCRDRILDPNKNRL